MIRCDSGAERVDADDKCSVTGSTGNVLHLETGEEPGTVHLWFVYPPADPPNPEDEDTIEVPPNHAIDIIDHGAEGFSVRVYPKPA